METTRRDPRIEEQLLPKQSLFERVRITFRERNRLRPSVKALRLPERQRRLGGAGAFDGCGGATTAAA
jgi:hypothetical protein